MHSLLKKALRSLLEPVAWFIPVKLLGHPARTGWLMLGPLKQRRLDRSVLVSLEALVPRAHFYRQLEAKLDLGFVRELVHGRYEAIGRPSIDPVVFFKLQLIMFFEGICSERRLIEMAGLHLAHRWYLGYHLDEPLPSIPA
jgi:transposase